ncbi:Outer membrane protein OmpA [Paracoccus isoporae]|uniref:Outer membrane protein OmpA n=2 Tax=Paracoccus isoporae TaxID=591205 RepID=A0A1G7D8F5_9RHOB|nr:Outer membrane protein OmpA [Paracoccus isoporae]
MRFTPCLPVFAIAGFAAIASPALAQDDLSVEDLVGLWSKQQEVFREAQSNGLGKTRGLELVTIDDAGAEAAQPAAGAVLSTTPADQQIAGAAGTSDPAMTDAPETVQPVVFGQLDPELQVNLQINFDFDSAALAETEKPKMQKICEAMKLSDVGVFRIVGHTDTAGSDAYNERLSIMRAEEVVRYLVDECGVDSARLESTGMGERFPFNRENPQADENRRVEFQAII